MILIIRYTAVNFCCLFRIITSAMFTPIVPTSVQTATIYSQTGTSPVFSKELLINNF